MISRLEDVIIGGHIQPRIIGDQKSARARILITGDSNIDFCKILIDPDAIMTFVDVFMCRSDVKL